MAPDWSVAAYEFSSDLLGLLEGSESSAMIHLSLDDVGNCNTDGMCAAVGYVAYKKQWDVFNWAWQKTLKDMSLPFLHTSEFLYKYLRVGVNSPTDEEIYKSLSPFIDIIHRYITVPKLGFGVCVITKCDDYDKLTKAEKAYVRAPDLNSFEMAIGLACRKVKDELSDENTMAIQMDEAPNAPILYKRYQTLKAENDTLKSYLGAICFTDDKKHYPIQAADMLGHLTLRAWRNLTQDKDWPVAFKELIAPNGTSNVIRAIYDLERLQTLAAMRKKIDDRMAIA